jgi:hypothetical protein
LYAFADIPEIVAEVAKKRITTQELDRNSQIPLLMKEPVDELAKE